MLKRENTQMNLYKKILDDQKKIFASPSDPLASLTGKEQGLTEIEKRQQQLDEKLYELANKHRKNFSFSVSLLLRRKYYEDVRILTVTHESKFK